jgi:2-methylcitrate dehydratase
MHPTPGPRKSWAAGDACRRAVIHALNASQKDVVGYPSALSAKTWGFYDVAFGGKPFEFERPFGSYVMENVLFKISFPAEFHAQTAVECAMRLHPLVRDRIDQIERIEIETQEAGVRIIDKTGPLANYADRDHCLQYMVAVPLIHGRLTASDYNDEIAADPRIDALRSKMAVRENPQFTRDYFDADKRYIGNSVQVFFTDGSSTERIAIDYPIGHRKRRGEGIPVLLAKCEAALRAQADGGPGGQDHGAGRRPGKVGRPADRSVHESLSRVRSARTGARSPTSTVMVALTRSSQGRH